MTTSAEKLPCHYCGKIHATVCLLVKAFEYYPDGTLKRVEFHGPTPISAGEKPLFEQIFGRGPLR